MMKILEKKTMKIIAAKDTVVCKNPAESKTKSGLVVPSGEQKPQLGIIVALGLPRKDTEMPIEMKEGDTIVFRRYSDNRMFIDGAELNFIDYKDIVGVLNA